MEQEQEIDTQPDTVVIHMTKCKPSSTVASTRIARFIADTLAVPLHDTVDTLCKLKPVRRVILVNGPSAFCEEGMLELLGEIVDNCEHFVWCMNDYTIYPPTQVRAVLPTVDRVSNWSTVPSLEKGTYQTRKTYMRIADTNNIKYINWNSLTYKPVPLPEEYRGGLFYYGAFRQYRQQDFNEYFAPEATYPIVISTTKQASVKFEDINPNITFIPPFVNNEMPPMASLYIEDKESHELYCSPANRFYECLAAGVPIFFDAKCVPTMETAGYDVSPWKVRDRKHLGAMIELNPREIAKIQRRDWGQRDYVGELTSRLKELAAL